MIIKSEIEEYRKNVAEAIKFEGRIRSLGLELESKRRKITDTYRDLIHELEEKRGIEIDAVATTIGSETEALKQIKDQFWEKTTTIKDAKKYVELKEKIETIKTKIKEVRGYDRYEGKIQILNMGEIYSDDYLHLSVYIVENEKPKNRFDILVLGDSAILSYTEYHYSGYHHSLRDHPSIIYERSLPTIEECQRYIEKNRATLGREYIVKHQKVREEYLHAIANFTANDFQFEPLKLTDGEAPIICTFTKYDKTHTLRLYDEFYWTNEINEIGSNKPEVEDLITVDDINYRRLCYKDSLYITSSSNILFGNWAHLGIEPRADLGGNKFTPQNWARVELEYTAWVERERSERRPNAEKISYYHPVVRWVHPELIS